MSTFNDARVRKANDRPVRKSGQCVLYWCQMVRRLTANHALDYAIHQAKHLGKPLVVYEGLKLNYPWGSARFHQFMLEGMRDNLATANELGMTYWPFVETPENAGRGLVRSLSSNACLVVTDDYPQFIVPAQTRALANSTEVAVHAVDGNCMIPLSLLGTPTAAAMHLRLRLHKLFPQAWLSRASMKPELPPDTRLKPPFEIWKPPADIAKFVNSLPIDQTVPAVPRLVGGSVEGKAALADFVENKLHRYAEERNQPDNPTQNSSSGLSPYLHYGHLGIQEVCEAVLGDDWTVDEINPKTRNKDDFFCRDANVNGFLDEAVTWRDVGYQWHFGRNAECGTRSAELPNRSWQDAGETPSFNFASFDFSPIGEGGTLASVLPGWAWASLTKHASDRRSHLYTLGQFENAETHDELWNAAQHELVATGKIHNYLRMLWAKKVLEWTETPEEAYRILEHLNNKYAIDGRDPNSYTGILWTFGLFDRPWPGERDVYGTIRYMTSESTTKKFKLKGYFEYIRSLPTISNVRASRTEPRIAKTLF